MNSTWDEPLLFSLHETSKYTIIYNDCLSSGLYLSPSVGFLLMCLIKLFVIFMSSVCNVSFVTS